MVTADEFSRCLRGAHAFLQRRPDALRLFEVSPASFWRSFGAIGLTLPAYVVDLAVIRHDAELVGPLFGDAGLAIVIGLAHLAGLLAVPVAMIVAARRYGFGDRVVPFVIVTNWLAVFASLAFAVPDTLLVLKLETPALTQLFGVAVAVVVLVANWHAARLTLKLGAIAAGIVAALGIGLSWSAAAAVAALA